MTYNNYKNLNMTVLPADIPLGEYVFLRILQANPQLKSIFGVPGDYNLNLMEYLYKDSILEQDVKFVGNCNELNAAYASDGYAKIMNTFSVLITTLGVGELSALNGIASAFAEFVPILHIVGAVATIKEKHNETASVEKIQNWHHLIQNKNALEAPDCHVFNKMSEPVSICSETLTAEGLFNGDNFDKIDNVITQILKESRPGYLFIPADLPDIKVPSSRLTRQPFYFKEFDETNMVSVEKLNTITDKILSAIYESESPSFMADDLIHKFHSYDSFTRVIDKVANNNFVKLYSSRIAKCIDERLDNFVGVYPSPNKPVIDSYQNDTDLLIIFGYANFETNGIYNGMEHYKNIKTVIQIHPDYVKIDDQYNSTKPKSSTERYFSMNDLIDEIGHRLDTSKFKTIDNALKYSANNNKVMVNNSNSESLDGRVSQNQLFNFANEYLEENDIILSEISSFSFDLPNLKVKRNVRSIYNSFYASIGYALPATLGVSLALKDLGINNRRVILFEGDGSAQMTAQEISTYLRYNITKPQILLMNNEGYTIERAVKGETRSYNDIQLWNWEYAGKMFGDVNEERHKYVKLSTGNEFKQYFEKRDESKEDRLEILEVMMYKTDYSNGLKFFLKK